MVPSLPLPIRRLALPIAFAAWSSVLAGEPAQSVILVRHAERAGGMSADMGISEAGRCRAKVLAGVLADAGVKHIYTSELARTQQTAEPLAKKLKIIPEVIPAKDIDSLVGKLRAGAPDGIALVVGHSNTVPEIIRRLSGEAVPPIGDSEYDRMFIVTLFGSHEATVVTLHYAGCAP
jgi:broad specificity phosphatase PhoE